MATFIANPNRGFRRWHINEIFNPNSPNSGPYVPNANDIIEDTDNNIVYKTAAVNYQTGVSTLVIFNSKRLTDPVGITDHFVSAGTGTIQDTFRLLVDTSKSPYWACLDSRLYIPGSNPSYVIFYKNEDVTSQQAEPVSLYFVDTNSEPDIKVPLTLNHPGSEQYPPTKTPVKFYVNQLLSTDDIVTMVVYDENDNVLSEKRLSVYETSMIKKSNSASRYVSSIQLESPALNPNNPRLVEIPINSDMASIQFMLRVYYSDGTTASVPVDGTRAKIIGLSEYISNKLGFGTNMLVRYIPNPGEYVAAGLLAEDGTVQNSYRFVTIRGNERGEDLPDSYAFKLHGFPRFDNSTRTWVMEYYLSTINRNDIYYVTDLVEYDYGSFDGGKLGLMQRFILRLDVSTVDPSFNAYVHSQEMVVNLVSSGNEDYTPVWYISEHPSQTTLYGENIAVRGTKDIGGVTDRWGLYLGAQASDLEEWLDRTYYRTAPIFDPYRDGAPLNPTHIKVKVGADRELAEVQLTDANISTPITVDNFNYGRGELIMLEFIRRTPDGDQYLSAVGMPLILNQV